MIALHLVPSLGPVRIARLVRTFGSARDAADVGENDLAAVPGIGHRLAAGIVRRRSFVDVEGELRRATAVGARVLTWVDAEYPARLRDLRGAPPVVYLRGGWDGSPEPAVAIVGTRRPSTYGLDVAGGLGEALGGAGVVVISGLARGIDRAAHAGALRRGGRTVAVLGCGVDVVYPAEHHTLMETMPTHGLRNRLISGMAQAVVVVEGGVDSGAMITARHAVAQQRVVYAVPGSGVAPGSRGPHHLLAEGAAVLRDPEEVLDRLGLIRAVPLGGTPQPSLGEDEARVLEVLADIPVYIDGIIDQAGLGAGRVAAVLATLEMRGLVRQRPGKRFARRSGFDPVGAQQHAGGDS